MRHQVLWDQFSYFFLILNFFYRTGSCSFNPLSRFVSPIFLSLQSFWPGVYQRHMSHPPPPPQTFWHLVQEYYCKIKPYLKRLKKAKNNTELEAPQTMFAWERFFALEKQSFWELINTFLYQFFHQMKKHNGFAHPARPHQYQSTAYICIHCQWFE